MNIIIKQIQSLLHSLFSEYLQFLRTAVPLLDSHIQITKKTKYLPSNLHFKKVIIQSPKSNIVKLKAQSSLNIDQTKAATKCINKIHVD